MRLCQYNRSSIAVNINILINVFNDRLSPFLNPRVYLLSNYDTYMKKYHCCNLLSDFYVKRSYYFIDCEGQHNNSPKHKCQLIALFPDHASCTSYQTSIPLHIGLSHVNAKEHKVPYYRKGIANSKSTDHRHYLNQKIRDNPYCAVMNHFKQIEQLQVHKKTTQYDNTIDRYNSERTEGFIVVIFSIEI